MSDTKQEPSVDKLKAAIKVVAEELKIIPEAEYLKMLQEREMTPFAHALIDSGLVSIPKPSVGFDEDKSQGSMPRLYEHIDRVDLWVMAQRKQHAKDAERIATLESKLADAVGALESVKDKTYTDPAEGPELRARAAFVYRLATEALERIKK